MSKILTAFAAIVLVIFSVYSASLDNYIAQLPYNAQTRVFYGEISSWCRVIYNIVPFIVVTIIVVATTGFFVRYKFYFHASTIKRITLVTLLSLALGPGLIANVLLKDHWGRPRPYQVLRDGKIFRPVYQPNFTAAKDNSFPSGHATIGFFLGVPLLALRRRKLGVAVAIIAGSIIGLVRILQGGHYFSDVVFSGIVVWIVAELVLYCYDKFAKGG